MKSTSRAFSLLEVLVAMTIFAVAVVTIIGLFACVARMGRDAGNNTAALYAAQEKLQQLLAQNVWISTSKITDTPTGFPSSTRSYWGAADSADPTHLQVINVEVDWSDAGRPCSLVLKGLVAP